MTRSVTLARRLKMRQRLDINPFVCMRTCSWRYSPHPVVKFCGGAVNERPSRADYVGYPFSVYYTVIFSALVRVYKWSIYKCNMFSHVRLHSSDN